MKIIIIKILFGIITIAFGISPFGIRMSTARPDTPCIFSIRQSAAWPYPEKATSEIEANTKTLMSALSLDHDSAENLSKWLYMLDIAKIIDLEIIESEEATELYSGFYRVFITDSKNNKYVFTASTGGSLDDVTKDGPDGECIYVNIK